MRSVFRGFGPVGAASAVLPIAAAAAQVVAELVTADRGHEDAPGGDDGGSQLAAPPATEPPAELDVLRQVVRAQGHEIERLRLAVSVLQEQIAQAVREPPPAAEPAAPAPTEAQPDDQAEPAG